MPDFYIHTTNSHKTTVVFKEYTFDIPSDGDKVLLKMITESYPTVFIDLYKTKTLGCNWIRTIAELAKHNHVAVINVSDAILKTAEAIGVSLYGKD